MKKSLKSYLMLAVYMATLTSCVNESDELSVVSDLTQTDHNSIVTEYKSGVPDNLDLEGLVIDIWSPSETNVVSENYISLNAELTGEVLDDAIYNTLLSVEEKLNVTLNFDTDILVSEAPDRIRALIMADDTTYDAFHFIQYAGAALSAEGLYLNIKNAPYISFDKPWWDMDYMREMTIGEDKLYCLVGDYAPDRTRTLNCVYYNKQLYEEYYKDEDGLYSIVLDGDWTIDKMREICTDVYVDLNTDGIPGREDQLGCCLNTLSNLDGLFYGSGAKITSRDEAGIPYIDMMNEHTANICEKLYELVYSTEGVYVSGSSFDEEIANRKKFAEDMSMFLIGFFYTAESLRDMDADYGIVPVPKLDKTQDDYVTGLHNIMRDIALPVNCQYPDEVCAVLEELAFQGNQTIIPAYYEVVLKDKYARDDLSAQMFDLIRDRCTTELAYVYGTYCNGLGLLFRNMISQKMSSIASLYASAESAAKEKLQVLIDQFSIAE
mgnify:CR=1 FL=1